MIAIADTPRPTSKDGIAALRQLGVRAVVLTGDSHATAESVAVQIGITEVIAEVLPGDKAAKIAGLQGQGRKVAMVGDRSTTRPRSPRPMSVSRSPPLLTLPSRSPTWC